ncbi:uncharacterized protein METZ01_LOCUS256583, partial [marine metagenome]
FRTGSQQHGRLLVRCYWSCSPTVYCPRTGRCRRKPL